MAQGMVKWFSHEKGYGFISPDDGGEELFVHYSGISGSGFRTLEEGERVTYEAVQGRKGMQAANVTPENATPATMSVFDKVRGLAREVAGTTAKPSEEYRVDVVLKEGTYRRTFIRKKWHPPQVESQVKFRYWYLGWRPTKGAENLHQRHQFSYANGRSILLRTDGELLVCDNKTNLLWNPGLILYLGGAHEARDDDLTMLDFTNVETRYFENRNRDGSKTVKFDYRLVGQVARCGGLKKALLRLRAGVEQPRLEPYR